MSLFILENKHLRVGIRPDYGARIVSLLDKTSGREWMTTGGQSPNTGENTSYGPEEAVGWDECFPTVGRFDARGAAWGRILRDHGDLWGRPWAVEETGDDVFAASYAGAEFRFSRRLSLADSSLAVAYAISNLTSEPLPFLWALHALLAVRPGDRIELPGLETLKVTSLMLNGERLAPGAMSWPRSSALPFDLGEVQPSSAGFAGKFIARGVPGGIARVGREGEWLELKWDRTLSDLGLWLTYGGWPGPGGQHEIAIEPTSAPADDLGQAMAAGALPVPPFGERRFAVTLSVRGGR